MKKQKNLLRYLPTFVFCIFIFAVPVMFFATKDSDFSTLEKRSLSQMPTPTLETVFSGEFGKDFETYLNDQMPLRTVFVGINSYFDQLCGKNGVNGIYNADDGYLITAPVESGSTLEKNIRYIGEFTESSDVPTYVCVVPSSGYIYEDKLPNNHLTYNDGEIISDIEAKINALQNSEFINITDEFKSLSQEEQLYYRTDHHWTSLGAYECYRILGEKLGYTPTERDVFDIERYDNFYGTNYSKSGLWFNTADTLELWVNNTRPAGSISVCISDSGTTELSDNMFYRERLATSDQYTVFLDGNHSVVTITNRNAESDKKLLILRDSYTHCLAPFLADNYSQITLVDMRYYFASVSALAKKENVDEILLLYSIDSIVNSTDIAGIF